MDDVVYFNPADQERPVVFNPLELDNEDNLDLRVDEIFTILNRALGDCEPRSGQILRHSLYALTELPETTLFNLFPLLDGEMAQCENESLPNRRMSRLSVSSATSTHRCRSMPP